MGDAPIQILDARGRPLTRQDARETRSDRWENFQTGIGTQFDKLRHGHFFPPYRVMDQEITNLLNGSALGAKIIEKAPREMMTGGFDLQADGIKQSEVDDFREWCTEELRLESQVLEAMVYGRAYGGTLLLIGCDDGAVDVSEPLDFDRIQSIDYLSLVDRRFAYTQSYYGSTRTKGSRYGVSETYLVSNGVATYSTPTANVKRSPAALTKRPGLFVDVWHESRTVRFDGDRADVVTRQQLAGWSWSLFQRLYESMRSFDQDFDSVSYLLSDASQGVLTLKGLIQGLAGNQKAALQMRLQLFDEFRSVMRTVALQEGETFKREPTNLAGIADILDRMMLRLAADADYPATELFGQSAVGLNATGDNDTRKWYKSLQTGQTTVIEPVLKKLFRIAAKAKNSPLGGRDVRWTINWHPLWSPSDTERADVRLKNAQADEIYVNMAGPITAEVVALERQDDYQHLDVAEVEKAMKGAKSFDPYENDPDPQTGEPQGKNMPLPLPEAQSGPQAISPSSAIVTAPARKDSRRPRRKR